MESEEEWGEGNGKFGRRTKICFPSIHLIIDHSFIHIYINPFWSRWGLAAILRSADAMHVTRVGDVHILRSWRVEMHALVSELVSEWVSELLCTLIILSCCKPSYHWFVLHWSLLWDLYLFLLWWYVFECRNFIIYSHVIFLLVDIIMKELYHKLILYDKSENFHMIS